MTADDCYSGRILYGRIYNRRVKCDSLRMFEAVRGKRWSSLSRLFKLLMLIRYRSDSSASLWTNNVKQYFFTVG